MNIFIRSNIYLLIVFLLCRTTLSAQDSATNKKLDEILGRLTAIEKKDTANTVGSLSIHSNYVYGYRHIKVKRTDSSLTKSHDSTSNSCKSTGDTVVIVPMSTVPIDSVAVIIKDGYILDIDIFSRGNIFTNTRSPIGLTRRRFTKSKDHLYNIYDRDQSIVLQEVLFLQATNSYIGDDASFTLTKEHKTQRLSKSVGINTLIDLRLYTDFLGLTGDQPNGIIQTDLNIKHFIHRSNFFDSGIFGLQYVKINANAAKFEKGENYVDTSSFSRIQLMERSTVNVDFSLNLFNTWLGFKSMSTLYWDAGAGLSSTKLALEGDTSTILTQRLFTEFGANFRMADNAGVDVNLRASALYSPSTPFVNEHSSYFFGRAGIEAYFNPLGDRASRVFGRLLYYMPFDSKELQNDFWQLQIGYAIKLSDLGKK